ncbi:MAG: L-threonylcarbamoyladenylate synthase [Chloroflexota bacterium]|nr:L-threonylcarbamoyladenylate synthase [Chloroflexota bacterium]
MSDYAGCQRRAEVLYADDANVVRAVAVLKAGGLVAFPTDTVYGLAAMPWDVSAVIRLYEAKRRPSNRPIPLLLSDTDRVDQVAVLPLPFRHQARQLFAHFWPGGLTLVFPKTNVVPEAVSHGSTVAVRVPGLSLARDLIRKAGGVLAVTSANISGQYSPINAREVEEQLGKRIDLILDGGPSQGGVPSSILDCTASPPVLLRHGIVTEAALRAIIGTIQV